MSTTAWTVTARKAFRCDGYRCSAVVEPGQQYARHVAFPDADFNSSGSVWVMRLCCGCATEFGRPMPPRRKVHAS